MTSSSSVPTLMKRRNTLVVLVAVVAALGLLTGCLSTGQSRVLDELNGDRASYSRRALPTQSDAQSKAQAWAERLARENRLYHSTLSSGIGVRWCALAENVGYGSSAAAIENAFMDSSSHRANILNSTWNGVGVGYAKNGTRVFVVHVFIRTC